MGASPVSYTHLDVYKRQVLRRAIPAAPTGPAAGDPEVPVLGFVGLRIDPSRREVSAHDEPVHLSALEFDVLTVLAGSPGRVFSRAQLLERVWGYDYFGDCLLYTSRCV